MVWTFLSLWRATINLSSFAACLLVFCHPRAYPADVSSPPLPRASLVHLIHLPPSPHPPILTSPFSYFHQSRPPPSAILTFLSPFLPFLPSKLKTYLFTAARYVSITTQFFQDLCVLLCALGLARWAQGRGNGLLGGGRMTAAVAGGGL